MSKSDKLKGLAEELVSFVNTMRSHFNTDLEGASIATCISYGECVGMLHNAANRLGTDIAKQERLEAVQYRPGVMLTHGGWADLKKLRQNIVTGEETNLRQIIDRLDEVTNTGLPWIGGDPT